MLISFRSFIVFLGASSLLCTFDSAQAQYEAGATAAMGQYYLEHAWRETLYEQINRDRANMNRSSGRSDPQPTLRKVSIGNNTSASAETKRRYIEGVRQSGGAQLAQQVSDYLQKTSIRTDFASMVQPYGLNPNEYCDVFSSYLIGMWMVANDKRAPSRSEIRAVRKQVNQLMLQGFPKGTAKEIQMQAEAMMYEMVTAVSTREYMLKAGNREGRRQLADTTQRNFLRVNKISLQDLTIDSRGMVPY